MRVCAGVNAERTITLIPVQPFDPSGTISAQLLLTTSPSRPAAAGAATSDGQTANVRPRRTGSLALFFRKVRPETQPSDTSRISPSLEQLHLLSLLQ